MTAQEDDRGSAEVGARCAGARPYMEDRHTIVANFQPSGAAASASDAGALRSFAGVYDGHNGAQTAEEAAARCALMPWHWRPQEQSGTSSAAAAMIVMAQAIAGRP